MLVEAIQHLRSMPLDLIARADAFEAFATQIETHSHGAWRAARGIGTDGSEIFLGRIGECLVVAPDGRIFRGALGRGLDVVLSGLRPNYNMLIALD